LRRSASRAAGARSQYWSQNSAICGARCHPPRQELTAQGNLSEALTELNKALDVNKNSSLAIIVLRYFLRQRTQSAAMNFAKLSR